MPRHAAQAAARSSSSARWVVVLAALAVLTVVTTSAVVAYRVLGTSSPFSGESASDPLESDCADAGAVRVFATPEIAAAADAAIAAALADETVVASAAGEGVNLDCLTVEVDSRDSATTLVALAGGTAGRVDVWLPDSSVWAGRAASRALVLEAAGSLGVSPVVATTSPQASAALGWDATTPSWQEVLTAPPSLATRDFSVSAPALLALASAGAGIEDRAAQGQLAAASVLGQERSGVTGDDSTQDILTTVAAGGEGAGVALFSEFALAEAASEATPLVSLSPAGPTPYLDYPVVDVGEFDDPAQEPYVDLVVAALASAPAQAVFAEAGLAAAPAEETALPTLDVETDTALVTAVAALERPSRILVVMDVSTSMSAEVEPGVNRAEVAGEAAFRALGLLPDSSSVGLWLFASTLEGDQDWTVAAPVRRLDDESGGVVQRDQLAGVITTLSDRLQPGGTSLYDVTLAAVREGRQIWEDDSVTTVVIVTDGRNEDTAGVQLDELTQVLSSEGDPSRPIGLAMVAFGPDADLSAIETIVAAAEVGGPAQALDARDPNVLSELLISLLSARVRDGATAAATPSPGG